MLRRVPERVRTGRPSLDHHRLEVLDDGGVRVLSVGDEADGVQSPWHVLCVRKKKSGAMPQGPQGSTR